MSASQPRINKWQAALLSIIATSTIVSCRKPMDREAAVNAPPPPDASETAQSPVSENDASAEQGECGFPDGTYSSTIDYFNPDTGYSATYTLPAEVEGCEIVSIDFNNGGYLAEHHYTFPAELDGSGDSEIESDRGQSYTVHIDKIDGSVPGGDEDSGEDNDSGGAQDEAP